MNRILNTKSSKNRVGQTFGLLLTSYVDKVGQWTGMGGSVLFGTGGSMASEYAP